MKRQRFYNKVSQTEFEAQRNIADRQRKKEAVKLKLKERKLAEEIEQMDHVLTCSDER